ncbi:hypothetical protein [Aquamicrobium terrae]|uniref:Uncharacterized protein n=1 Tax=Aquamicrobium terrae TaxID=1324945 RepID=A0ABV2MY72_9HYPH
MIKRIQIALHRAICFLYGQSPNDWHEIRSSKNGPVMRRISRDGLDWEYRPMTEEETRDFLTDWAIK